MKQFEYFLSSKRDMTIRRLWHCHLNPYSVLADIESSIYKHYSEIRDDSPLSAYESINVMRLDARFLQMNIDIRFRNKGKVTPYSICN